MRHTSLAYDEECNRKEKGNCINRINVIQEDTNKRMRVMNTRETPEAQVSTQEIILTPEAAEQVRLIRKENQVPETHGLRIGIQSGGCCGSSYLLAFDENVEATDKVFQSEGISIFVDEESLEGLSGTTLEYVDGPQGKGFKFNNPNKAQSCGCGDGECSDGNTDESSHSDGGCGCGGH
jgi:iron-sulfur cluster assembly protein